MKWYDKHKHFTKLDKQIINDLENNIFDDDTIYKLREKYNNHKFKCLVCNKRNIDIADYDFTECEKCEKEREDK